jgi:hypothetical protein
MPNLPFARPGSCIMNNYSNGFLGRVKQTFPTAPNRYRFTVESIGGAKLSMSELASGE